MSDTVAKPRTVLILQGLELVDTQSSKLELADIYYLISAVTNDSTHAIIKPEDDVMKLKPFLPKLTHIACEFPVFTDGRAYSQAALLRKRLGYTGKLRAVGDVLVDQVRYMARAGFDEIELREDQSLEVAKRALQQFAAPYQSAQDNAAPVWVRYAESAT